MVERQRIMRGTLALLLLAAALVWVAACTPAQARFEQGASTGAGPTGSVTATIDTATAAPTTASQPASNSASAAGSGASAAQPAASPTGTAPGISATEANALAAELSAIQSELDRLAVPSDSDFDNIGSGLK